MGSKRVVRKVNKKNPYLRLVKSDTGKEKQKEQKEKVRFGKGKRIAVLSALICLFLGVLVGGYRYVMDNYTITTVYVEGNIHYTNEEIMNMVMEGKYGNNSLFLSLKYRDKGVDNIPFIETMDVAIEEKDTIRITVYEKAIAGCVFYLGRYMYFDNDGIIVETSEEATPGIPQVTGLSYDYVILHEPLPVENQNVFQDILNITHMLSKYSLSVDKIYFSPDYQVTLIFGNVQIAMGDSSDLDEKISKVQYLLPSLEGKEGVVDMREYTEETDKISFKEK
ncbi:MAG: cell division protein FtsQ [Lachnospiraceae bacterium]|nr:cell division protein FtsQ [Lachnospiraceae bacterium]